MIRSSDPTFEEEMARLLVRIQKVRRQHAAEQRLALLRSEDLRQQTDEIEEEMAAIVARHKSKLSVQK